MKIDKQTIYNQHKSGMLYICPQCKSAHIGGLPIENLDDDGDELPQVYCRYGCGYIFLPIKHNLF